MQNDGFFNIVAREKFIFYKEMCLNNFKNYKKHLTASEMIAKKNLNMPPPLNKIVLMSRINLNASHFLLEPFKRQILYFILKNFLV